MPNFGLYYPDFATWNTAPGGVKWELTDGNGPQAGSGIEEDDGLLVDVMADQATFYTDEIVPNGFDILNLVFANMNEADRLGWRTFRNATRGKRFQMYDTISEALVFARLARDGIKRVWAVNYETGDRYGATIRLRIVA